MNMNEKVHKFSEDVWYSAENQTNQHGLTQNPRKASHDVEREPQYIDGGWVVDVETTVETPMEVMFGIAMRVDQSEVRVGYNIKHTPNDLEHMKAKITEYVSERYGVNTDVTLINGIQRWLSQIIDRIADHNDRNRHFGGNTHALIAHNAEFDLPMCGTTFAEIEDERTRISSSDDGLYYVKDKEIKHMKAGAYGRIYKMRRKGDGRIYCPVVDTMVVAKSLWQPSKLSSLSEHLDVTEKYSGDDEEYGAYTDEHMLYCVDDVCQTRDVYDTQQSYLRENMPWIGMGQIYSSASLGKSMLADAGYNRVLTEQDATEKIMASYVGGQTWLTESKVMVNDISYVDILSQYPTASALGGVWKYMTAEEVYIESVKPTTLPLPTANELGEKDVWEDVAPYICEVVLQNSKVPVRTECGDDHTTRIVWSNTTTDDGVTMTLHLADLLGADMLRDEDTEIKIVNAYKMCTRGEQDIGTTNVGSTKIKSGDNVMAKTIERRKEIQKENDGKNAETKAHKVVANSIYGVSAERIADEKITANANSITREARDMAGTYFSPALATSITALGRLMLAFGRFQARRYGGSVVYCDTDSLVISGDRENSRHVANQVISDFNALNPYPNDTVAGNIDMLEYEDVEINDEDVDIGGTEWSMFVLGTKKYCILRNGEPVKWTEHGLGHMSQFQGASKNDAYRRQKTLWSQVMSHVLGEDFDTDRDLLYDTLTIQTSVSTHNTRQVVMDQLNENVKYGDFYKIILTNNDETVIDVGMEHSRIQPVYSVLTDNGIEQKEPHELPLKRVKDVANTWAADTYIAGHPEYLITGKSAVNKESYDLVRHVQDNMVDKYKQLIN